MKVRTEVNKAKSYIAWYFCDIPDARETKPKFVSKGVQVNIRSVPQQEVSTTENKLVEKGAPIATFVLDSEERALVLTGLRDYERQSLWCFLGEAKFELQIIGRKAIVKSRDLRSLSVKCQFLLTLIVLRRNYTFKEIAVTYKVGRKVVSQVFRTWLQFMFFKFKDIEEAMFTKREDIPRPLPRHFANKLLRDVRVVIDCTEIFLQSSQNYTKQGHLYSSYKNHTTAKTLIGCSPSGRAVFVSNCYEGSISDREIVKQSGFLDFLETGDVVLADRGFTIEDLVREKGAKLILPPFLKGRKKFSLQETQETKVIAKARIHIERFNERLKKYQFLQGIIPHCHNAYLSQAVYVCACLVNFSAPLAT